MTSHGKEGSSIDPPQLRFNFFLCSSMPNMSENRCRNRSFECYRFEEGRNTCRDEWHVTCVRLLDLFRIFWEQWKVHFTRDSERSPFTQFHFRSRSLFRRKYPIPHLALKFFPHLCCVLHFRLSTAPCLAQTAGKRAKFIFAKTFFCVVHKWSRLCNREFFYGAEQMFTVVGKVRSGWEEFWWSFSEEHLTSNRKCSTKKSHKWTWIIEKCCRARQSSRER